MEMILELEKLDFDIKNVILPPSSITSGVKSHSPLPYFDQLTLFLQSNPVYVHTPTYVSTNDNLQAHAFSPPIIIPVVAFDFKCHMKANSRRRVEFYMMFIPSESRSLANAAHLPAINNEFIHNVQTQHHIRTLL